MNESSATPAWMVLKTPEEIANAITCLYRERGDAKYDEVVSQTEHGLQCGSLAMAAGADDATIVAAFLHDIGHLLLNEHDDRGDAIESDLHHEEIGARFLANWFGDDVLGPVRLHVPAKRYLCAVERDYQDGLSAASVRSLVVQGGPMTAAEQADFEALEYSEQAVALRRWDDAAKLVNAPTPGLEVFEQLLAETVLQ